MPLLFNPFEQSSKDKSNHVFPHRLPEIAAGSSGLGVIAGVAGGMAAGVVGGLASGGIGFFVGAAMTILYCFWQKGREQRDYTPQQKNQLNDDANQVPKPPEQALEIIVEMVANCRDHINDISKQHMRQQRHIESNTQALSTIIVDTNHAQFGLDTLVAIMRKTTGMYETLMHNMTSASSLPDASMMSNLVTFQTSQTTLVELTVQIRETLQKLKTNQTELSSIACNARMQFQQLKSQKQVILEEKIASLEAQLIEVESENIAIISDAEIKIRLLTAKNDFLKTKNRGLMHEINSFLHSQNNPDNTQAIPIRPYNSSLFQHKDAHVNAHELTSTVSYNSI